MRRFSLIMVVVAVMILCLGISSTVIAAGVIRIDLVDTAGGTAAGHAKLVPAVVGDDLQVIIVGRGLAEGTSYFVGISGVVNTPQGPRSFVFVLLSGTTNAVGVLTLHDSFVIQGSIVRVDVAVSSGTSSDPALFGTGVVMNGPTI